MAKRPAKRPMNKHLRWLLQAGSACGAIAAIVGLWITLGLDRPAWSSDIQRLDRHQAETAVEIYQSKVRGTILNAPARGATPQTQRLYEEELNQARTQLKHAEDRKIELSK